MKQADNGCASGFRQLHSKTSTPPWSSRNHDNIAIFHLRLIEDNIGRDALHKQSSGKRSVNIARNRNRCRRGNQNMRGVSSTGRSDGSNRVARLETLYALPNLPDNAGNLEP